MGEADSGGGATQCVLAVVSAEPLGDAVAWAQQWRGDIRSDAATPYGYVLHIDCVAPVEKVRAWVRARRLNAAVLSGPLASGPPGLVVVDGDSTLTTSEAIDLLAEAAGSGAQVAELTERAMHGELDFESALVQRVATLKGLPQSALAEVATQINATPGADLLVAQMHAWNGKVAVVSGGFHELIDPLATRLGLDAVAANRLDVAEGRLTGRLQGPIIDARAKTAALLGWAGQFAVPPALTMAAGDGANDLDMIAHAGVGVAFQAKPAVVDQADAVVGLPRLDALLGFMVPPQLSR